MNNHHEKTAGKNYGREKNAHQFQLAKSDRNSATIKTNDSDIDIELKSLRVTSDEELSEQFVENVNAAYFSYKRKAGKWDFQAGLRAENTISEGKLTSTQNKPPVSRNYLDFFPSAGITYNANPKNAFGTLSAVNKLACK